VSKVVALPSLNENADSGKRPGFAPDWPLLAILGLATGLRLLIWLFIPHPHYIIDEAEYYQISSIVADGRGWMFYDDATWVRPPLYILLIAGIFKFFGPNLIIVRLVQIAISVASVYLLFWLGQRLYGRRTGLMTALLGALAWPFVVFPYLLLSETLFIFLFLLCVCFLSEFFAITNQNFSPLGHQENKKTNKLLGVMGSWWFVLFPQNRKAWLTLLGGGICLGLAALTRGQVLSFVPFILIWFWLALKRKWQAAVGAFLVLLIVFAVTVSPWVLRNVGVYGRPMIDSTGGYNFYLGALKGRNGALVSQTLEAVKNQAERDSLGYQKGLQIFFKDPADFIFGKGVKESLDFWQINFGADERLVEGYTKGAVNPIWLTFDAVLNDLFYIVTGALALLGLVVAPASGRGGRSFVIIWTVQNMILAFAFFAVTRFRVSVYFFLLLFAAYTLANWREVLVWFKRPLGKSRVTRYVAGLLLPVLFLVVVLPSYSPFAALVGTENGWATLEGIEKWSKQQKAEEGDRLRLAGKYQEALAAYAQANQGVPQTQIGIGLTEAELGKFDEGIGRIGNTSQDIAQSHIALGYIYLLQGNRLYARSEFNSRQVSLDELSDNWAWDKLKTLPLLNNELNLGEFDWGYTSGFQIYEKDAQTGKFYRWTAGRGDDGQGRARLRFPGTGVGNFKEVTLRLRGYRPDNLNPPLVEIYANGQLLAKVQTTRDWADYTLKLPTNLTGDIIIEIGAPTFVPGATSRRELGVMVESAKLK